ncbi:hypothetical protein KO500_06590 [Cellulophaga baltica]|uniref:hypothetical protein n=1 Tax=Cellulophaga TaxID=104264 RepID=UPI001C064D5A|nr:MULTISPECIES: hypothetical protein [Cellulophaga]MBU2996092.1 hypothetical protein [Cellulophaga baltica]MDO6767487.1 hypothetical protein [Cellulophaga sp. 1_MG-2023]
MSNLEGTYRIIGFNQDKEQTGYTGVLKLIKTANHRVNALWTVVDGQTQTGKGFFKDDILVINFAYIGELDYKTKIFKGVVVYKIINDNTLEGFWSEKYGDNDYLGYEECQRITEPEVKS